MLHQHPQLAVAGSLLFLFASKVVRQVLPRQSSPVLTFWLVKIRCLKLESPKILLVSHHFPCHSMGIHHFQTDPWPQNWWFIPSQRIPALPRGGFGIPGCSPWKCGARQTFAVPWWPFGGYISIAPSFGHTCIATLDFRWMQDHVYIYYKCMYVMYVTMYGMVWYGLVWYGM